jgi:hypothetical protein
LSNRNAIAAESSAGRLDDLGFGHKHDEINPMNAKPHQVPAARSGAIGEPRLVIGRTLQPRLVGDDMQFATVDFSDLPGMNQLLRRLHGAEQPIG